MSGNRYLLDTSIAIQILEGRIRLEPFQGRGIGMFLCLTVVGELLYGAAKSGRPTENHDRVERLLARCPLVAQDVETASHYGRLKAHLRELGRPIPENDLWIAASALRHDLTLATRDRHFDLIEDLRTERW